MSELLAEGAVLPLYGQVVAEDAGTTDLPDWETGDEQAVASEHAVLIATRPDQDGDVHVRVARGAAPGEGDRVFRGEMSVTSGRLAVGSPPASQMIEVDIGHEGYVPVQILADPVDLPERVTVIVGK